MKIEKMEGKQNDGFCLLSSMGIIASAIRNSLDHETKINKLCGKLVTYSLIR